MVQVIFTWLILGAMLASEFFLPQFYFRLAFVVFLTLDCLFWLSAWAWAARLANLVGSLGHLTGSYDSARSRYYGSITAATVLGAFVW